MCINKLLKKYKEPSTKEITAYKLVETFNFGSGYGTPYQHSVICPDVWMRADRKQINAYDGQLYMTGFHVLKTRRGAEALKAEVSNGARYLIVKVRVRRITYEGTDGTCDGAGLTRNVKNLVAHEMMISSKELEKAVSRG